MGVKGIVQFSSRATASGARATAWATISSGHGHRLTNDVSAQTEVLLVHGVETLVTINAEDFQRFATEVRVVDLRDA